MSKTPGGQAASEKFLKREAASMYSLLNTLPHTLIAAAQC